jgi:tRNA threonylcarbamoyladenosine biosynthesis protein TsaB
LLNKLPLILNIDTATESASVCLSENDKLFALEENSVQKEHAAFIHEAIKKVMDEAGKSVKEIDAIAITAGPGSYTGLRVGMSTAKGLCYVLQKPLITINTLKVMACAAIDALGEEEQNDSTLFCPMIDARRMEVFTALYDASLKVVLSPCAMVLDPTSFDEWLENHQVVFSGSGRDKFEKVSNHTNVIIKNIAHSAAHLGNLAQIDYLNNTFADLAYIEPCYLKDFHSTQKK